jgi:hypothetical protein
LAGKAATVHCSGGVPLLSPLLYILQNPGKTQALGALPAVAALIMQPSDFNPSVSNLVHLFEDMTITSAPSDYFLPLIKWIVNNNKIDWAHKFKSL